MSDEKVESAAEIAERLLPCKCLSLAGSNAMANLVDSSWHHELCPFKRRESVAAAIEAAVARERESKPPQKMFPIQDSSPIPWEIAERAYATYVKHGGSGQSLRRLAERGGFGLQEFACFFHGHYPNRTHTECVEKADSVGQLIARLQADLATAEAARIEAEQRAQEFQVAAESYEQQIATAEQRGREAAAHELEEPYRESIFAPLTEEELTLASETLQKTQRGLIDRLHAGWARHWATLIRERGKWGK